jgi:aryl-alcohol dehydrogenase-like predicted oxidoreductase
VQRDAQLRQVVELVALAWLLQKEPVTATIDGHT